MSYQFDTKKVKRKFIGQKKHLVIQSEEGIILDHFAGESKGIKRASFLDKMSFQGKKVKLDGKKYVLKQKSLNKYFIRNGTRLTFDRYGSKIHRAISKGFDNAIRFIPRKGLSKSEMRGQLLLKCVDFYTRQSPDTIHFPYDKDPAKFKENYQDPYKWEKFFISLWNGKMKK